MVPVDFVQAGWQSFTFYWVLLKHLTSRVLFWKGAKHSESLLFSAQEWTILQVPRRRSLGKMSSYHPIIIIFHEFAGGRDGAFGWFWFCLFCCNLFESWVFSNATDKSCYNWSYFYKHCTRNLFRDQHIIMPNTDTTKNYPVLQKLQPRTDSKLEQNSNSKIQGNARKHRSTS